METRHDSADAWQHRVDRGELLRAHERSDGTLLVEGYAAREGVLEYRQRDGSIRRELVLAETLAASANSLARAPVTLEHPAEDVTPDNVERLQVGDTDGEVFVEDGGFVRVRMAIRRRDAIDAVKRGKREVSAGYAVRLDATPGVHPKYGRYDAIQVERRNNHLALTDRARAGSEVRVRADGVATTVISSGTTPTHTPSGAPRPNGATVNHRFLPLLALLGITSRVDSDDAAIDAACDALNKRNDAADKATTKSKADLDAMTAKHDAEKARADRLDGELAALKAAEAKRVDAAERGEIEDLAKGLGVDPKAHTDAKGLRKAIAKAHLGEAYRADASDDYDRAVVDLARKADGQRGDGREAGNKAWEQAATGGTRDDAANTRRTAQKQHDRWGGQPLPRGGE